MPYYVIQNNVVIIGKSLLSVEEAFLKVDEEARKIGLRMNEIRPK